MRYQHLFSAVALAVLAVGCGAQEPSPGPAGAKSERAAKIKAGATLTNTVTVTLTLTDTQTHTDTATATVTRTSTQTRTGTGTVTATSTRTATGTVTGTLTRTTTSTSTATATQTQGGVLSYNQIYVLTGTVTSTNSATVYYTQWAHSKGNTSTATTTQYILTTASKAVTATVTSTFNHTETKTVTATMTGSGTSTGTTTVTVTATMTSSSFNAGGGGRTLTATGTATNTATQSWTYHQTATITRTLTNTTTGTVTATNTVTTTTTSTTTPTVTTTSTVTATTTSTVTDTVTRTTSSTRTATSTATETATSDYIITPSALDFGNVGVGGTSIPQNITVQNPGAQALPVPPIVFAAGEASKFQVSVQTSSCFQVGGSIAPGGSCQFAIFFSADVVGTANETVLIDGTTVTLTGTGVGPTYTVTPRELDFGMVGVGGTSIPQNVTVTNPTGVFEPFPPIVFATGEASKFQVSVGTSSCVGQPGSLAPGGSCQFAIFFSADVVGTVSDSVLVDGATVALTGTGVGPSYTVTPRELDFGTVGVGGTSIPQNVTVTNPTGGFEPVPPIVFATGEASKFHVSPQTSSCVQQASLAPGGSCQFAIFFSADVVGTVSDSALVDGATVALTGTGVGPSYTVTPRELDFGTVAVGGTSIPQNVTVTNPTGVFEPVPPIVFATGEASKFQVSVGTSSCLPSGSLAPGGSCQFAIFFSADVVGTVSDSALVDGATVALTGTGVGPSYTVTPRELDFGTVAVGATSIPQNVTVTNPTGVFEPVPSIVFATGEASKFQVSPETSSCVPQGSLAPGGSCQFAIFFSATVAGTVSDSALVDGATVALTGTGVGPSYTVTPRELDFGTVEVGATSIPQTVTVTNPTGVFEPFPPIVFATGEASKFQVSPETSSCVPQGSLAPGGSCQFAIFFSATVAGTVSDSALVDGETVALTGTGAATP